MKYMEIIMIIISVYASIFAKEYNIAILMVASATYLRVFRCLKPKEPDRKFRVYRMN